MCTCVIFLQIKPTLRLIIEITRRDYSKHDVVVRGNRRKVDRAMRILGTDGASGECRIGQTASGASSECRGTVGRKSEPGA